ncbi:MAG: oligoendopeptidase F [Firmicutes bacterium]|nr:oligoendopeptidase F [Bacillota bacterium]
MAQKQKTRSEIDKNYQWDLSTIYGSIDEWNKEYISTKDKLPSLTKYKGSLLKDANTLLEFLNLDTEINRKLDKLFSYAHLLNDEDTTNTKNQELFGKIVNLNNEYSKITTFVKPELLKSNYEQIKAFYKDLPELKEYEVLLEEIYRYKEHTLDEREERIVAELNKSLSSPSEIFEKLTDADMKFPDIVDEKGNSVEFTESNYSIFIRSKDRRVRKDAFNILHNTYGKYKNTLSETYASLVEVEVALSKIYNFESAIKMSLFDDNIDVSVYDNLVKTVNENLKELYKYYDLRKKILNLDEQHLYDTYVSLVEDDNKNYTFSEAKDLVLKALSVLGDDYVEILNKAFDEKWIDVFNNVGKRSGAYSSGCYDTNPFILLNFEGKLDDVSTLSHELGHSVHSYLSREFNSYQNASYKIFVAEVASTVNELLLNNYMLKNTSDKNEKLSILNKQLELFKSTIFRQTMFAEFERDMHAIVEQNGVLTNEVLCDAYYKLVKKYFGDSVYIDETIKYEWSRIPHFYYNFYVYKYATGLSAAAFIASQILSGNKEYIEKYKNFLKLGGSMYPIDELKQIDIDMTKKEVVESAIEMFKNTLEEFEKLIDS